MFGVKNRILNKIIEFQNKSKGWKTDEKIIVFESDDWGMIRTSSKGAISEFRNLGLDVDKCHYMLYDGLETVQDLQNLFRVLGKYTDRHGNHPIFTLNTIMANPDFDRIKNANYSEYYYELFTETYKKNGRGQLLNCWFEGITLGLIYPQFHGREHVNIFRWLNDLKSNRKDTSIAFENKMFGLSGHIVKENRESYLAVFDEIGYDKTKIEDMITEGIQIFKETFGFKPKTFIAPNYVWSYDVEEIARKNGIICMQGKSSQIFPKVKNKKGGVKKNYTGKVSETGIGYLVRNAVFEPASDKKKDWVISALNEIELAFKRNRPAIIDTHRVNYMGSIQESNRYENLKLLDELLEKILLKWPDVKFFHSESLANLIFKK